ADVHRGVRLPPPGGETLPRHQAAPGQQAGGTGGDRSGDAGMMFALYLVMLVLVLLKPVEAFAPELAGLRIALVVSLLVFALALGAVLRTGEMAIRGRHVLILGGLVVSVVMSQVAQGWMGGAS